MNLRSIPRRGRRIDELPQRTRRLIAVATLVALPAMYAWSGFWAGTTVSNVIWGPVSFLLIGVAVVGGFVLYRYVSDRADLRDGRLDERERHLRDQAWILSYEVLSVVAVAVVATITIAVLGFGQQVTIDASMAGGAALSIGLLLPLLPAAALAWIEPDRLGDA